MNSIHTDHDTSGERLPCSNPPGKASFLSNPPRPSLGLIVSGLARAKRVLLRLTCILVIASICTTVMVLRMEAAPDDVDVSFDASQGEYF